MNNKKLITILSSFAIFLVVLSVILFVVHKNLNSVFWVSYVFMVLSILIACGCVYFAGLDRNAQQVSGMPVNVLGVMYMAVEVILGIILICVPKVSFAGAFIPQLVLFAIFLAIAIPAFLYGYKSDSQNMQQKDKDNGEN